MIGTTILPLGTKDLPGVELEAGKGELPAVNNFFLSMPESEAVNLETILCEGGNNGPTN
jgi:hypothetical protein